MIVAAGLFACGGGETTETAEKKPISNATQEEPAEKEEMAEPKEKVEESKTANCKIFFMMIIFLVFKFIFNFWV